MPPTARLGLTQKGDGGNLRMNMTEESKSKKTSKKPTTVWELSITKKETGEKHAIYLNTNALISEGWERREKEKRR